MAFKDYAGAIVGGLTTLGGWLGIGEKRQDRRQIEQQGKLNEQAARTARQQADYEQELKMKMWKDTNYSAQLKEAEKAGVSKAAAIGGSGTGTQGASVSAPSGGNAADAASSMNAATGRGAAGLETAAQLNLMKAQADNLNADTESKKVNTAKTAVDTDVSTESWRKASRENETFDAAGGIDEAAETLRRANQKIKTESEKEYNDYETYKAAGYKGKNNNDPNSPLGKAISAGLEKTVTEARNLKKEGKIKDAQAQIEGFKARLTEQGLAPDTPWFYKLISDVATKLGFNPLDFIK